ncbi:MAG: hypothetical protein IJ010_07695 [Ruminococcus sp.]|nr:hypothetical protein [Ruminococcus sp.]
MKKNLGKLIDVKSIVTLTLTAAFVVQTVRGAVTSGQFLTVFTTVIAFYFGTQYQKNNGEESE